MLLISITVISWKPTNATKNIEVKTVPAGAKEYFEQYVNSIYQVAQLQQTGMNVAVLQKALTGYLNLKLENKLPENSNIITVVDFSKSSREKRMWIIDVLNKTLLLNTWVAHGQGSGDDMATMFSNTNESHQSSLGFYLTEDVYMGKHGRSLRLNGLDEGINSAALARGIVVHAADYVGQGAINAMGRLGRSFGCPAVSPEVSNMVINTIKGHSMMFIHGNSSTYTSKLLDETAPMNYLMPVAKVDTTHLADNSNIDTNAVVK
ncbi:hypothetical protein BC343_00385 [Mucilaginibacter pedocola]|uniref:Murein L,D-transpeptidase catalytic domain family protein n=2 Tax=Mucilaginibacter pedocola TaxID=1792845 RepID=A0A1S9PKT8_9SPHI|nr:hypothetical protein BC343_00385 [Mucilaginibacter pedocola]